MSSVNDFQQKIDELQGRLRSKELAAEATLKLHKLTKNTLGAVQSENAHLRESNAKLQEQKKRLNRALGQVPWRVVGAYRRVFPFIPRFILLIGASLLRRFQRAG